MVVGMGAIPMNGASVGDGSIVAAGAIVTEGKSFPPRSLIVGAPAKAVHDLDVATAERLKKVAMRYDDNWQAMVAELTLIV